MSKISLVLFAVVVALAAAGKATHAGPNDSARRSTTAPARDAFQQAMVSAIHHFAADGELDHLRTVLEKYPDLVKARRKFNGAEKPVRTDSFAALHYAAEEGRTDVIEYLVDHGADVNDICYSGMTPLHLAAWSGHLATAEALVEHGARTDTKTEARPERDAVLPGSPDGKPQHFRAVPARTPLDLAKEQKHPEVVEFLTRKPH